MSQQALRFLPILALVLGIVDGASGQRGGRGPSEDILSRSGSYFVDVKLPASDEKKIPLEACSLVQEAAKQGHLALLYLYDPRQDAAKHAQFEQTILGHAEISVALRLFQCGRVNLAEDEKAKAELGARAPLFVVFDAKGAKAGELAMPGYSSKAQPVMQLLQGVARNHARLQLAEFVKRYREFLNDYQVYEGRKKTADERRDRLTKEPSPSKAKLDPLDRELAELEKGKAQLLEGEKKLLELAKATPRDANAKRLGDRPRGGGGGGGR